MFVTERTMLVVPSQRLIRLRPLAMEALSGCPGLGEPVTPKIGGTLPGAAPLTAKMEATRLLMPLVKLTVTFVTGLALVTFTTASKRRGPGRPRPRKSYPGRPGAAKGLT